MNFSLASADLRLLTFDCYGTLIDWESGVRQALEALLSRVGVAWNSSYFDHYMRCEAEHQRQEYKPYRDILGAVEADLLTQAGITELPPPQLADSLADWQPFPDTVATLQRLKTRYQLGILSNIDRDLFAHSARRLGVNFDLLITAEDVQAYKPAEAHFQRMLRESGLRKDQVLHVAQSLYHDAVPCNALGIRCVWINRRAESPPGSLTAVAEFRDLAQFADAVLG